MITGERGIKLKKVAKLWHGSRRNNIPLNLWLVAITRKHKQHNQDRRYNIQKSQGKKAQPRHAQDGGKCSDWR